MIFVIDVGNTHTVLGVYENEKLRGSWRMCTDMDRTSDETGMFMVNLFNFEKMDINQVEGVIISSVVPPAMSSLERAIKKYFKKQPMIVGPGIKTGLNIKYENPREVGADRIVNAVAGLEIYGGPLIIVDFGTATTFDAISDKGEYLGGVICPGVRISAEALFQRTAKLPRIELAKPEKIVGKNTVASMQSGVVNGYIGQVEYIVKKMKQEMKYENIKVIATGGLARMIAAESEGIDDINGLLTLEGLKILYNRNRETVLQKQ